MTHDHGGDASAHGVRPDASRRHLMLALALLLAFMVAEVVVALASGSLALLSDAGHMLSDVLAVAAALWAMRLAARPPRDAWTFGWKRAEILSAAGNGVTLLVVAAVTAVEAIRRLLDPPTVQGWPVAVVAVAGIGVNLVVAWLLARANRSSLNVEGAYQHIVSDLYGFVATLVAALVIIWSGWNRADPIASLVVVVLMLRAGWRLVRASTHILLEAAPSTLDLAEVRQHMVLTPGVRDVHDLHVWTLTSDLPTLSAHIVVDDSYFTDGRAPQVLDALQSCLGGHFDVEHSTFQLEPASHAAHEHGTH